MNVGVFNDSSSEKTFFDAGGDGEGTGVDIIRLNVPGFGWAQKAVTSTIENGAIGWGCAQSVCSAYPWVVTVNNQSNDGQFAPPIVYTPPDDN